ncbi:MAG: DUF885 domain-containing protein [Deltaproteobacteria bacterium]|nr:DUF885 domain-containing protein [Deltaproteobacteria bacterium]
MQARRAFAALLLATFGCGPRATTTTGGAPTTGDAATAGPTAEGAALERLGALASEFVVGAMTFAPSQATAQGYHRGRDSDDLPLDLDTLLDDLTVEGVTRRVGVLADFERRLADGVAPAALDLEGRADLQLLRDAAALERWTWEEVAPQLHDPTLWVERLGKALTFPLLLPYDPPAERARDVLARLERVAEYVARARATLQDAAPVWVEVALAANDGNRGLVRELLPRFLADECGGDPDLLAALEVAAPDVLAALDELDAFLRDELPRADPDAWRLGTDRYAWKLALAFHGATTPEELLADAETELAAKRAAMLQVALPLLAELGIAGPADPVAPTPGEEQALLAAVLEAIGTDRVARDGLLGAVRQALAETDAVLTGGTLLTHVAHDNLSLGPTPVFMRGLYGVGGLVPPPPFEPQLGAWLWITPIPEDWDEARVEQKLREYNREKLRLLAWHESVPGYFTHSDYASRVAPTWRRLLRSVYGDQATVEGWSTYAEELMLEATPHGRDPRMVLTYAKEELRGLANVLLDVGLHTRSMTDDEALALMTERTFQERAEAEGKLRRAKLSSTQLCTYYLGASAWRELRAEAERAAGAAFDLRAFHDRALGEGAVPLPLLREIVLGGS